MSTSLPIPSSLLLLVLLSILLPTHGKHVGESCVVNGNSPGQCKLIRDCPRVYEEMLAGKAPNEVCGFFGFDAIICCPTTNPPVRKQTPQPQTSDQDTTTEQSLNLSETMESVTSSNMMNSYKDLKELLRDVSKEETCMVDNFPGVCKLVEECPQVHEELLAGKKPSVICRFEHFEPVICCPTTNRVVSTNNKPAPPPQTPERDNSVPLILDESRGSLARAKCAQSAKAIYDFRLLSTPRVGQQPVNTSLCALKDRKLVVGGTNAEPKEFPHMAAIGFEDSNDNILWLCSGGLISSKIVLTAAHCTWASAWGSPTWVRLGDLNLAQTTDNARPQTIAIEESIRHPDYKYQSEYHDIAILRLEKEVTYDAFIRPACLPVDWPDVGQNDKAVATGWGIVEWTDDKSSDNLLKVTLQLVSHEACNKSYFVGGNTNQLPSGIVNEWQICAGEVDRKDTCQGDSGGPLVVFSTDYSCMYTIIGITSLGHFCGSTIPGVFTRVYHYIPWIERTAWPEFLMSTNLPIASSLSLLVLVSILSLIDGNHVGESCVVDNSPGECKLIPDCRKVYEELLVGTIPSVTCGYFGFNPIVCCPATNITTNPNQTAIPVTTNLNLPTINPVTTDPNQPMSAPRPHFVRINKTDHLTNIKEALDALTSTTTSTVTEENLNSFLDDYFETETCMVDNSPGECKPAEKCPQVYQDLLAGKMPSVICTCSDSIPLVCCPTTNREANQLPAPQPQTSTRNNMVRPLQLDGSRGSVAQAKCAEVLALNSELPPPETYYSITVVGGEEAGAKEFPHMAAVGFDGPNGISWLCGGSLISSKIVLTAAHCTWTFEWGSATWVRLGDLNLVQTNDTAMPQTIAIEERIRHPNYTSPLEYHDIAILRLKTDATYNAFVRPACLPFTWPDVREGDRTIAVGWGRVDWTADTGSDDLLKVYISLVPHESCNATYFDNGSTVQLTSGIVNEWQICAGEEGKDTCQGDSGGPLLVNNEAHKCMFTVVGVTSLGRLCGIIPGVYTRVSHYIPWIERTAWPEYF
ncbi:PREDICTED: uncharacterized protein LOC105559932 [Vollenhovia emeryi]|uniref:uncharacterized protein LOC105559932 n=1 Tax=Vollenhovia emeryi TaxID=411798 RepID=UPI0005F509F9|nr:PREDICTED: uncharacterized protein LOC105559932 [Vollenhovia emeryi]